MYRIQDLTTVIKEMSHKACQEPSVFAITVTKVLETPFAWLEPSLKSIYLLWKEDLVPKIT